MEDTGDSNRRAIRERVSKGPVSASRLAEPLGITLAAVAAEQWIPHCRSVWERRLRRLEELPAGTEET